MAAADAESGSSIKQHACSNSKTYLINVCYYAISLSPILSPN